ncbi:MAG: MerR family transcriptional regulator [Pseudomonadota bacterium]
MAPSPATAAAPPGKPSHSIGELAREFGITTRAIRHYEQLGLLKPARRGQTRIYSPADRVTLILILRGNRLGFTLAESRELIGLYDPASGNVHQLERLLAKLAERRAVLERQLADIRDMQNELDDVERRCRDALCTATEKTGRKPKRATGA